MGELFSGWNAITELLVDRTFLRGALSGVLLVLAGTFLACRSGSRGGTGPDFENLTFLPSDILLFEFRHGVLNACTHPDFRTPSGLPDKNAFSAWKNGLTAKAQDALRDFLKFGIGFDEQITCGDEVYLASGRVRGAGSLLTLVRVTALTQQVADLGTHVERLKTAEAALSTRFDAAPMAVWESSKGKVTWASESFRAVQKQFAMTEEDNPFANPAQHFPLSAGPRDAARMRVKLSQPQAAPQRPMINARQSRTEFWFDLLQIYHPNGDVTGYAVPADPIVQAESALKRFVETLTKTFADLPIGLAIFDSDKRLNLFNPAVGELLCLDPAWMAGRPSLQEFLHRLRENRRVPDQKDFAHWQSRIAQLADGGSTHFQEDWVLSHGQVLRVTGRPYPVGSLALLFEDITLRIEEHQTYRSLIEIYRAMFAHIEHAAVLMDASGTRLASNLHFDASWGPKGFDQDQHSSIHALIELWRAQCGEHAFWDEVLAFVTGGGPRQDLEASLTGQDGRRLIFHVQPLPSQATFITIKEQSTERTRRTRVH